MWKLYIHRERTIEPDSMAWREMCNICCFSLTPRYRIVHTLLSIYTKLLFVVFPLFLWSLTQPPTTCIYVHKNFYCALWMGMEFTHSSSIIFARKNFHSIPSSFFVHMVNIYNFPIFSTTATNILHPYWMFEFLFLLDTSLRQQQPFKKKIFFFIPPKKSSSYPTKYKTNPSSSSSSFYV